jgi:hypothetical protein
MFILLPFPLIFSIEIQRFTLERGSRKGDMLDDRGCFIGYQFIFEEKKMKLEVLGKL